jgi:hypothetical protein
MGLDFERAKIHHADITVVLLKPSLFDSFSAKLKVS